MTTSSLRIIAVGIAVIFAVLTGLFTGMVGGSTQCTTDQPSTQVPGQNQEASPGTRRRGAPGIGEDSPGPHQPGQQPGQDGDSQRPGPGGGLPGDPDGAGDVQVEAEAVEPVAVALRSCGSGGFSVPAALTGFLGTLIAAGAVAALWFIRGGAAPMGSPGVSAPPREQPDGDRSTLVQACIYVRDRATSKALADRLGWALQEAGVSMVTPTGARFDPAHHEAGGSVATDDPARVGTIAGVELPGYVDRGVVLRAPVVTVYRRDSN
ncbi:MAG TPA: nucleotide exchange factor GrpE [Micromonosporaceae bacterium]